MQTKGFSFNLRGKIFCFSLTEPCVRYGSKFDSVRNIIYLFYFQTEVSEIITPFIYDEHPLSSENAKTDDNDKSFNLQLAM